MANERKTETIVRETLRNLGYFSDDTIIIEEQSSNNPRINKLLKSASKSGSGQGYPEFIISSNTYTDLIIVIECKADPSQHESSKHDQYKDYAVDGALLYASYLSKEYDVIAIGVSGESKKDLKVSHYIRLSDGEVLEGIFGDTLLSFNDYYSGYISDPHKFNQDYDKLLAYSRDINETLHAKKIKESQRSLLISGILIALNNPVFYDGFSKHRTAKELGKHLVSAIGEELVTLGLPEEKSNIIQQNFNFIKTHTTLSDDKSFFDMLIRNIDKHINSFRKTYMYFDTLGQFYIEFLRYANNDKGLGIVLTPPHITSLFAELGGVNKDSVVLDNTCGTGGFLISAMRLMVSDAKENSKKIDNIYKKQLIGIEHDDDIYPLAVTNMVLHDDGKGNIFQGNCFNFANTIRNDYSPTVGLLNPPYRTKKGDKEEFEFVLNNLEMLQRGGICVAIVPIRCVLAKRGKGLELKRKLLRNHTLEAVLSMPPELFHNSNVGVVTATVIITAHIPHDKSKKTWFAYCRDDGFIKVKKRGRIDKDNMWSETMRDWVTAFKNRETIDGFSLMHEIQAKDEWCVEAYMETDYSKIKYDIFENELMQYSVFNFQHAMTMLNLVSVSDVEYTSNLVKSIKIPDFAKLTGESQPEKVVLPDPSFWKWFTLDALFDIKKGKRLTKYNMTNGMVPFVGASKFNNGITDFVGQDPEHPAGTISVNYDGSVGETFYQASSFLASDAVNILYPKFDMNPAIALFIGALIKQERYRFSYGRKWPLNRMKSSKIKLPVDASGKPDWELISEYMHSLRFSTL